MEGRAHVVAGALGLAVLSPLPSAAITQTAGTIEQSGNTATVDLWFFTVGAGGPFDTGIQLDPISGPFTTEDLSLRIHSVAGGIIGAEIGADGAAGGSRSARVEFSLGTPLASGDYVAIVSASDLSALEFGPTQDAGSVRVTTNYELTLDLAGGNESIYTCSIEGTLRGSFDVTKYTAAADCRVPGTAVPEPGSLALLAAGLAAAAGLGIARRPG